MGYIVDLTLILCDVFESHGNVSLSRAKSVVYSFAGSGLKTRIHNDISSLIRAVPRFEYNDNDIVMTKIIDLSRETVIHLSAMLRINDLPS